MRCLRQTALTARTFSIETGWPPPELFVTVSIKRDALASGALNQRFKLFHVHVAFERVDGRGMLAFVDHQIHCLGSHEFHIRARGVEMRIVGDDVALPAHHAEQNAFGSAALVSGNYVTIFKDVLDG